ncbi:MAG: WecB/TagA/CpsF family glycosyltransferase [Candidatus Levybacteria bacterium]|nr:WecB/TagA/CpsF family glycosyltransferase [Candidatus Levybacteria bacterium]
MLEKKKVLEIGITDATENEILKYIITSLEKKEEKYYIVTPNPEILVYSNSHSSFKTILNNARIALCDGIGIIWAGKILGQGVKHRVGGTDFIEKVCSEVCKKPITVGFLGGRGSVAEKTAECLQKKYPGLKVVFAASEWPENSSKFIRSTSSGQSSKLSIDILFVAFGFPKQEEWIAQNLDKIPVKMAMGVGGAFDYISGNVRRAPVWIRNIGLEWLYRLIRQPWRIKRQLALLEFIFLVLKKKFTPSK